MQRARRDRPRHWPDGPRATGGAAATAGAVDRGPASCPLLLNRVPLGKLTGGTGVESIRITNCWFRRGTPIHSARKLHCFGLPGGPSVRPGFEHRALGQMVVL